MKIIKSIIGFIMSIVKPIEKYSTTIDNTVKVKEIPKESAVNVAAFYSMVVQPNSIFELLENKDGKVKLIQLSTGKVININYELFKLNFKEHDNSTADKYLDKIIKESKATQK